MKSINELLSKYWKGSSEVEEEQALKKHFCENERPGIEDKYFNYLEHKRNEKLNDANFDLEILHLIKERQGVKKSLSQKINWKIAAAILILFTTGILFINKQINTKQGIAEITQTVEDDTFEDPQMAFEETKKALLLISGNLNKGNTYTSELVKFSDTQENLKKLN